MSSRAYYGDLRYWDSEVKENGGWVKIDPPLVNAGDYVLDEEHDQVGVAGEPGGWEPRYHLDLFDSTFTRSAFYSSKFTTADFETGVVRKITPEEYQAWLLRKWKEEREKRSKVVVRLANLEYLMEQS